MNKENNDENSILPNGDNAAENAAQNIEQVEEIIQFYEQRPDDTKSENIENEAVHDSAYGLNRTSRTTLTYIFTALACAVIIIGSYAAAILLPSNNEATEEYADALRKSDSYKDIKDEYSALKSQVNDLQKNVSEKKEQVEALSDPDNTKAELRAEIEEKSDKLKELNNSVKEKNESIAAIDTEISAISGIAMSLSPGRYTVGKDIAPGKYSIMGRGSFAAASSTGQSKYNTTLNSSPVDVELSSGDRLKLDCTVKFTPAA